jgi:hypothetical protein
MGGASHFGIVTATHFDMKLLELCLNILEISGNFIFILGVICEFAKLPGMTSLKARDDCTVNLNNVMNG